MTLVYPSSTSKVTVNPRVAFILNKCNVLSRCSLTFKFNKQPLLNQKYILSDTLFPNFRRWSNLKPVLKTHIAYNSMADKEISLTVLDASAEVGKKSSSSSPSPSQVKVTRPVKKSDMPPVKNEELIPGSTFTGKVVSVKPFGAFVDFGAFTDGLVHISNLTDSFVKDVADVVTVGQEVKVRLVEINMDTRRISLTMRENGASGKKDGTIGSEKYRSTQKKEKTKGSKFIKGQDVLGTIKVLTRTGAIISLPEGEEGFLPSSEEVDDGFVTMMGGSLLEIGQEVNVRVLRISRGQVTLTMKKEEAGRDLDAELIQGVVHKATNPFVLAFRSNKDIAAFLDEQDRLKSI